MRIPSHWKGLALALALCIVMAAECSRAADVYYPPLPSTLNKPQYNNSEFANAGGQFTVNNSVTLVDVTGLTVTLPNSVGTNTYWRIEVQLLWIGASAGMGAQWQLAGTAFSNCSPTVNVFYAGKFNGTFNGTGGLSTFTTAFNETTAATSTSNPDEIRYDGVLNCPATTGGIVKVQFAQNTATVGNLTLLGGSYIHVSKL
jgi:hypothetical protein